MQNEQFQHDQFRAQADGFLNQYTDKMHRAVADILGRIRPGDKSMRLNVQSLALSHITEGVKLMIGMGMDDGEIAQLASKAAQHARAQSQLARQEIEAEAAQQAHDDMLDALADAHMTHLEQPEAGTDPNAPKTEPAPQPMDQSQPAPREPSQNTGQLVSPPNSPQDKIAAASMTGQTFPNQPDPNAPAPGADPGSTTPAAAEQPPKADAQEQTTNAVQQQNGDANAQGSTAQNGVQSSIGMADQADAEVVKPGDQADKAAADAKAAAAKAAQ